MTERVQPTAWGDLAGYTQQNDHLVEETSEAAKREPKRPDSDKTPKPSTLRGSYRNLVCGT